jgi:predicted Fe-Mo cluster-binding NifX family protein
MKVAISANDAGLDAPASPIFGRCSTYVFVDTDDLTTTSIQNPAVGASGGAGIQAAQLVIEQGAQALITGNIGPNALQVFQAAGIPIYTFAGGTVRQAVAELQAGNLQQTVQPTARAHAGMSGMGSGRGMGGGGGRGMGGGGGRGMGGGGGRGGLG